MHENRRKFESIVSAWEDFTEEEPKIEKYVNNENARRIEELRAAMRQAEFGVRMKDFDSGTTTTKNSTLPFSPC